MLAGADSLLKQPGDAARDNARFAAAGAGEDEQRSLEVRDRLALRRRQIAEQVLIGFVLHAWPLSFTGNNKQASTLRLGFYRERASLC